MSAARGGWRVRLADRNGDRLRSIRIPRRCGGCRKTRQNKGFGFRQAVELKHFKSELQ